jgi:hypothetical protein
MVRDIEAAFTGHRQIYPGSAATSVVEMMLKLMGIAPPDLQAANSEGPTGWSASLDQVYGHLAIRSFAWDQGLFPQLLSTEIAAGRPVGMMVANSATGSGRQGERGWIAVRANWVSQFLVIDLRGKSPELGAGEGRFSESRVLRADKLLGAEISGVIYCDEIMPRPNALTQRQRYRGYCSPVRQPQSED